MLAATPITSAAIVVRQAGQRARLRLAADRGVDPVHGGRVRLRRRRPGGPPARLPRADRDGARVRRLRAVLLEHRQADAGCDGDHDLRRPRRCRSGRSSSSSSGRPWRPRPTRSRAAPVSRPAPGPIAYLNPFLAQAEITPTDALCARGQLAPLLLPVPRDVRVEPERRHLRERVRQPRRWRGHRQGRRRHPGCPAGSATCRRDSSVGKGRGRRPAAGRRSRTRPPRSSSSGRPTRSGPKTVVGWLILSVVFLVLSIQFVSPTRRWRFRRGPRPIEEVA